MKRYTTLVLMASLIQSAQAANKPDLAVPPGVTKLSVALIDTDKWNGKRISKELQCIRNGGIAPVRSPALKVDGVPAGTSHLVVFFNNPKAMDNHGLFSVPVTAKEPTQFVPNIVSGARSKLPQGAELFQGGSSWSAAYNAPCPTSGSWRYTVSVFAISSESTVTAVGEVELGWSE